MSQNNNAGDDPNKEPHPTRWKEGQSGNPQGRPKGATNKKQAFNAFMEEPLLDRNGQKTGMNTREGLWKTLRHRALVDKDPRALKILMDLDARYASSVYKHGQMEEMAKRLEQLEKELAEEKLRTSGGVLVVPAEVDMETFRIEADQQRKKMLADQEARVKTG